MFPIEFPRGLPLDISNSLSLFKLDIQMDLKSDVQLEVRLEALSGRQVNIK